MDFSTSDTHATATAINTWPRLKPEPAGMGARVKREPLLHCSEVLSRSRRRKRGQKTTSCVDDPVETSGLMLILEHPCRDRPLLRLLYDLSIQTRTPIASPLAMYA
jgi:hypothetical protein